jgi:hypothetical protein
MDGESERQMTLSHGAFRDLLNQLERQHGATQELRSPDHFVFVVLLDDGAEYLLRWPRGVRNPIWEVARQR